LVGADGVKSVVRASLFEEPAPRFTNFVTWRAGVPADVAPVVAETRQLMSWMGEGRFFVLYPIRGDLLNMSAYVPADEMTQESWTATGDIDELRLVFDGSCETVMRVIDSLESVLLTGIYTRDPLVSFGTERIMLLGDAAHA